MRELWVDEVRFKPGAGLERAANGRKYRACGQRKLEVLVSIARSAQGVLSRLRP